MDDRQRLQVKLMAAAQDITSDGAQQARLVNSFQSAINGSKRNPLRLWLDVDNKVYSEAMAQCIKMDLFPSAAASPISALTLRQGRFYAVPNHRGWTRIVGRLGYSFNLIPIHRDDPEPELVGERVIVKRSPTRRRVTQETLVGVAVYIHKGDNPEPFKELWVYGETIRKRAGKSKGGYASEWYREFACAAAIRDVFQRGLLPVESPEIDAAMDASREQPATAQNVQKTARSRVEQPLPDVEVPKVFQREGPPDALEVFMDDHNIDPYKLDQWCAKQSPPRPSPSQGDKGYRDQVAAYLASDERMEKLVPLLAGAA